jgi:steroid delta-isomerase-like uncharacterized protein
MSTRANKQLVMRVFDTLFNDGALKQVEKLVDPAVLGKPMGGRGPHETIVVIENLRRAFPDLAFDVEEMVAEGDRVVARWTMTGTQFGPLFAIAATGRGVAVRGITIFRINDGRWAETWGSWDMPHMLSQLGHPIPGLAAGEPPA